jgi:tetratricopeptide (TPR) repeat protein
LFGSAAVVASVGIWQYLLDNSRNPPPFPQGFFATVWHLVALRWIPQSLSPAATFGNPNFAAQYVVLTMPLGAGLFLTARTRAGEWLAALACSLMGVYLLNTFTKACWVAVSVGTAFMAALLLRERFKLGARFLTDRVASDSSRKADRRGRTASDSSKGAARRRRKWHRTAALVAAAVFALVLGSLTPKGFRSRLGGIYRRVAVLFYRPDDAGKDMSGPAATRADAEYRSSIHYRYVLWGNTLEMMKDHPVLGVGIGNWRVQYVGYSSKFALDEGATSRRQPGRAHNDHLQVLAELGLVGAALYLWLGYAIYRAVIRALGRGTERETRYLAMAVAAGVVGIIVDATFSLPFQLAVPPLIMLTYLAMLGGALAPSPPGREQEDTEPSEAALRPGPVRLPVRAFYSAAVVVAILFVVHAVVQLRRIKADLHFRKMDFASVKGDWKTVVVEGMEAHRYDSRRKKTLVTVAGGHIRLARSDKTIEAKRGRLENAVAMLKEVVEAYPCNLKAYNHLGVAYMEIAELERKASPARFKSALAASLAYFKSALEVRPEYADVHCNLASVYDKLGKRDEAVASLGRALWYDPKNPMLLKNMAIAWTKRKDLDKALVYYKRAVEARTRLFDADLSLRNDLAKGRLPARLLIGFRNRRVSLSENISISRGKDGGTWRISDLGTGRTYFAEEKGNALKVYAQKDDASVYGAMAGIHMSRGEVPEALRNYRLAAKLDRRNATYQHELGVSAFRMRRYPEAKVAFQNTLRLKPGWALAHKNLGMVQIGFLGEKDEGLRHLREALRLNPEVAGAVKVRNILRRYGAAP